MKAYFVRLRGRDDEVVAAPSFIKAAELAIAIASAEEDDDRAFGLEDVERVEELGEFIGEAS